MKDAREESSYGKKYTEYEKSSKLPMIAVGVIILLIAGFFGVRTYQANQEKNKGRKRSNRLLKIYKKATIKI